jgi:hypothetical protein
MGASADVRIELVDDVFDDITAAVRHQYSRPNPVAVLANVRCHRVLAMEFEAYVCYSHDTNNQNFIVIVAAAPSLD